MKKLICLIMGMLIFATCFSGLADSAEVPFAQIRENTVANVYAKPGDETPVDTLEGGRIFGLLGETEEAGAVWFHIFYLDSQKQGRDGYIEAEKAEKLSQDALTALMADPDKFNEILDLIDAVNASLSLSDESADETADQKTGSQKKNNLKDFYEQAMDAVKEVSGAIGSADLNAVTDAVEEIGEKAVAAGEDLFNQLPESAQEALKNLEKIDPDSIMKDMQTKLDALNDKLEKSGISDDLDGLKTKVEDILKDEGFDVEGTIKDLQDKVTKIKETTDTSLSSVLNVVEAQFPDLFGSN